MSIPLDIVLTQISHLCMIIRVRTQLKGPESTWQWKTFGYCHAMHYHHPQSRRAHMGHASAHIGHWDMLQICVIESLDGVLKTHLVTIQLGSFSEGSDTKSYNFNKESCATSAI